MSGPRGRARDADHGVYWGSDALRACYKNDLKPWRRLMWCIGTLTEKYRCRMYNLLKLYVKPMRDDEPVICIDEKSLCNSLRIAANPCLWRRTSRPSWITNTFAKECSMLIRLLPKLESTAILERWSPSFHSQFTFRFNRRFFFPFNAFQSLLGIGAATRPRPTPHSVTLGTD